MKNTSSGKKLLLVGSTHGSVHLRNYYHLIKDYFEDVLVISTQKIDFCRNEVINFSLKNPLQSRKSVKRIRQIIQEENPDVIHVHQANACAYLTAKANAGKKPLILTTWGSDVLLMPQKGFLYRRIVSYALKHSDVITADAKFMAKAVADIGISTEVVIANYGIEYEQIEIPQKENVIYSNRLHHPLYRIDWVIKAFAEFHKKNPDWKLIVGAKGQKSDELKQLAAEILQEGSYEFIGFVDKDENQRQYLRSKIWVSVPESDGTAISLLEAMGYGCVPVVSDLPANKEWIEDQQNGQIVQNDLKEAIEKAAQMDLSKVQEQNINIVLEKATKKVNREIYQKIYDQLID
ncbi:MAG: glycosyltransferase family 4 protein [Flavobacteriales bacterium]|nr:glycosyltransferase family 4 protein [Flavobacteriales bacterium]